MVKEFHMVLRTIIVPQVLKEYVWTGVLCFNTVGILASMFGSAFFASQVLWLRASASGILTVWFDNFHYGLLKFNATQW
ncbi:hypothetical protein E2542_SST15350 [Spatholobus suberectus]|nr:hypothetical protein E2542_SST15350 [Spatholobus suberectus]